MDTFLKIKQEASGFPEDCKDQEKYINDFYDAEVVKLEHAQEKTGLRALAKMKLNKTWGKLSQKDNLSKTEYITKPADYFELITCPTKKVKHVSICREEMLLVNWEDTDAFVEPNENNNVVVASYVTSQARLHLYQV